MNIYKVINVVGTSEHGFSDAVKNAVNKASETIEKIRYVEVERNTAKVENQAIKEFRVEVKISFEVE